MAQEESNRQYVETLRAERVTLEDSHKGEIASHVMEYEELRTLARTHYESVEELKVIRADLTEALALMTRNKEFFESKLAEKEAAYDVLLDKFEKKSMELLNEKKAHKLQVEEN